MLSGFVGWDERFWMNNVVGWMGWLSAPGGLSGLERVDGLDYILVGGLGCGFGL